MKLKIKYYYNEIISCVNEWVEKLKMPEKSFLLPVKVSRSEKFSVIDLFKLALKAEKMSEEFYKEAGERAENKESKRVLGYLALVERSHYFMIKSEIDMLDRFPDYYKVEDFHLGQDMFHVGPWNIWEPYTTLIRSIQCLAPLSWPIWGCGTGHF